MADGVEIGKGTVTVGADLSSFDAAMAALPAKAAAKMNAAAQSLKAEAAKTKIELGLAWKSGDLDGATRAGAALEAIEAKIKLVEAATIKQGQAAQAAANEAKAAAAAVATQKEAEKAAIKAAAAVAHEAAQQVKQDARDQLAEQKRTSQQYAQATRDAAKQASQASRETTQQARQDAAEQLANQRRVAQQYAQAERARLGTGGGAGGRTGGGMSGAMGLMVLSQTIDDAQYGFKSIVNQIPQLGMGLASIFGKSGEAAMKFGAIAGIAGVAINYLVNHAGEWASSMGFFATETKKSADALEALRERIKELEAKPIKLAIDTFEVDQAKKKLAELEEAARAFKKMGETASPAEKASGEAVEKQFGELGNAKGDKIQHDLKAKMATELITQSKTVKAAEDEEYRASVAQEKAETRMRLSGSQGATIQASRDIDDAKARVEVAREASRKAKLAITSDGGEAEQKIGAIWAEATKGNVDAQKKLVARLRAIGEESLAKGIEGVSPDLVETPEKKKAAADAKKMSEERAAINEAEYAKTKQLRDTEDSRLAGAMTGSVGQKYLSSPGMDDASMQREVKEAMKKAGMSAKDIGEAMAGTAKKLRENLDKAVKDRALDRGISEGQARGQLAKEAQAKDDKQAGAPKSEVMSTESYVENLLVGALNQDKNDPIPEKQLREQEKTNVKLDDLAKKWASLAPKNNVATFARGR